MQDAQTATEAPAEAPQHLWTKKSEVYVVEMLVGNTWVRQRNEPYDTLSTAELALSRAAQDSAVKEVRLCALKVTTVFTQLRTLQPAPVHLKSKPGFRPTGATVACRLCKTQQPTALDSTDSTFVFCSRCDKAYPC